MHRSSNLAWGSALALLFTSVAAMGCGGTDTRTSDGGGSDAPPGVDSGGGSPDAGPVDAGPDSGLDAGSDDGGEMGWGCGTLAPPDAGGLCCSSCSPGSSTCQANGCYGGWWCDTESCRCQSAPSPADCAAAMGGVDGGWPTTTGALACTMAATYSSSTSSGSCGVWRWAIKTGADAAAASVDTTPVVTTIAHLVTLTPPSALDWNTRRTAPTETTVFELRNVHVQYVGRSADSDNHMIVDDGTHTMIVEVPYPGCVASTSVFGCNISHARAAIDAAFGPVTHGMSVNRTATIIGAGFFDFVHMQPGVAPNGIELHPVLAICFGTDCDPLAG